MVKALDKGKILDFMEKRKDGLYDQVTHDFAGGLEGRLYTHNEVKFWKEAIERGEFDSDVQEVYVILSLDIPELADFTFFTDKETVSGRVEELNKLAKGTKYFWVTLYDNFRNSGNSGNLGKTDGK